MKKINNFYKILIHNCVWSIDLTLKKCLVHSLNIFKYIFRIDDLFC